MEPVKYVSPEEIAKAKELTLLDYLQRYEPGELLRLGPRMFTIREHDSVKIRAYDSVWYRWSTHDKGRTALDYLIKVRGMEFKEAVAALNKLQGYIPPDKTGTVTMHKPLPSKQPFRLPTPAQNNHQVIRYLSARGIDIEMIEYCIQAKTLYQDHRGNCVFVGYDYSGKARYAMLRSSSFKSTYSRDFDWSDKRFSFGLRMNEQSDTLHLFESSIDALSYATIQKLNCKDWCGLNYKCFNGIYQPAQRIEDTASPSALEEYLKRYTPSTLVLCLDNDEAGHNFVKIIKALYANRFKIATDFPDTKDWNSDLQKRLEITLPIKMRGADLISNKNERSVN